jgi:hypothetical protein
MGWLSRYKDWVYELDDGVRYPADARGFPFSHTLKIGFGAHRVSDNMGTLFPGVSSWSTKLTDNHPLLPKVKIVWRCAFAPPYVLMAWCAGTNYLFLFQFVILEIFFNEIFYRFLVKFLHPF